MNRLLIFTCIVLAAAAPASAQLLGGAAPVVIVRDKPSAPFAQLYFVYVGSLSDMVTAEEAVGKVFAKSGVAVIGASSDISDVAQLKDSQVVKRVTARIAAGPQPTAIVLMRPASVAGTEATFRMTINESGRDEEIAAAETLIDTSKQIALGGAGQSARIAVRDASRRLLSEMRIRELFQP